MSPQKAQPGSKLLERRARELARAVEAEGGLADGLEVITFHLGGERYAIDTRYVLEVSPLTQVTRVPGAGATLVGVANLRGTLLPVFDLAQVLGLEHTISDHVRVLVLGRGRPELGVVADRVEELTVVPRETLRDGPTQADGDSLVLGMTEDALVVLDGGELLDDRRFHPGDAA